MAMRHQKRVFWLMANNPGVVILQSVSQNTTMTEGEKMKRANTICILLFTLGSATMYTIPHWNDPPVAGGTCMFPNDGPSNAIIGGIGCGIGGLMVSSIVG